MGNASSFSEGWTKTRQRWHCGPFRRHHIARLSSLKIKIQRIVKRARAQQAMSNHALMEAAQRVHRAASDGGIGRFGVLDHDSGGGGGSYRLHLGAEGVELYREAIAAVGVVSDGDQEEEFVRVPGGHPVRLSPGQFDDLIAALQSVDPEPCMRRLGLTPMDQAYTGALGTGAGRAKSDFRRDLGDVESVLSVAKRWSWPSVQALEDWVYVVS